MNTPPPDPFDRALAAYSAREQGRAIPPPAGFADRTAAAVLARPRWQWKAVAASATALLVAAVAVGYAVWPKPQPTPEPRPVVATPEPTSPNIGDTLSEAGGALAKLGRTTAEKATPRTLLPGEAVRAPEPKPGPAGVQPATDAIASMPSAARSGLEPVTGRTRRALAVFLRDTGLKAD
jgi:hypothetical protein